MSVPLITQHSDALKAFINMCTENPSLLHQPHFAFVKEFIEHFGGTVPKSKADESPSKKSEDANPPKKAKSEPKEEPKPIPKTEPKQKPKPIPKTEPKEEAKSQPEEEAESEESDLELDMSAVVEPDTDAPQKMGNLTLQPTEEEIAESQAKRSEAISAFAEGDYAKAVELYTEAIVLNPQAALLYAKRGQIYVMLKKPNACIRDCDRALELNPDNAAAYKFRGYAYYLLGKFEEAAADLRLACKLDFDEEADEWLRIVTPNARRIEEHRRKQERKMQEKQEKERQEKLKESQEAAKAQRENAARTSQFDSEMFSDCFDENFSMPQDAEIAEFFNDMRKHPSNVLKYYDNPKIMAYMYNMSKKCSMSNDNYLSATAKAASYVFRAAAEKAKSTPEGGAESKDETDAKPKADVKTEAGSDNVDNVDLD